MSSDVSSTDEHTAAAFATSWNTLPAGSVYTREQFEDWLSPVRRQDCEGKRVLELGCGNASLLVHMTAWNPAYLEGIDLGDSVTSAITNMSQIPFERWAVKRADLTTYRSSGFEFVYCIGVLHHLTYPEAGVESVIRNVAPGGRFHCWVYGHEGNALVRWVVDPIRRLACRLPWWVVKYVIAFGLSLPFYIYAKAVARCASFANTRFLFLSEYSRWIARRNFRFFWHVAFDQLVSPRTRYIKQREIQEWLNKYPEIDPQSIYVLPRNANSWKFGGVMRGEKA